MTKTRITRIHVSCDSSPLGEAALAAAAALAQRLDAELAGLFVEDANLLRMASLPFVREVALVTGTPRRIDAVELELALRRQASHVREALSRVAQGVRVPWSFQVVRGTLMERLLEDMREPGLAVLGHASRYTVNESAGRSAISEDKSGRAASGEHRAQPALLVLYDGSEVGERALDVAMEMARSWRAPLTALVAANGENASALRERVNARLKDSGVVSRFQVTAGRNVQAVKQLVGALHVQAVIWPGLADTEERGRVARLVDELPCPVLLVT